MITAIYKYLQAHTRIRWGGLAIITALFVGLVMQLSYKEDISDFLPLGTHDREALDVYQDISGANRLIITFSNPDDVNRTVEVVESFSSDVRAHDKDGWAKDMTVQYDMEKIAAVQDYVYANIPFFLTDSDYRRMDSLLSRPEYVRQQLESDKEMLMFPNGGMLTQNIGRDPLNLFSPILMRLQSMQQESHFEMYDGYIFTSDMSRAIVMLPSPFGNAETDNNSRLLMLLDSCKARTQAQYPGISIHIMGGPQIAVGNAQQIKQDSIIAVVLAVVLIMALLAYSFRSMKNILLIALSIGWGWLFAMGGIALLHDKVSIIVIGISSVILGIAVNYPLHLVAHTGHEPDMHKALKDISMPLLIGNITTVGAFLALVPLQSTALRDLGLFASLLLIGTIVFVLIILPHHVTPKKENDSRLLARLSTIQLENKPWLVTMVAILTVILGIFSLKTEFDSNMANINYMTEEQRSDMEYFQRIMSRDTSTTKQTLYVVSSAADMETALDTALAKGIDQTTHFLCSKREQARRLEQWKGFKSRHAALFTQTLEQEAARSGFAREAFDEFHELLTREYSPKEFAYFEPLTTTVFAGNISIDKGNGRYSIVDKIEVEEKELVRMRESYAGSFDVKSMNSAIANALSDNFNYIGWACSLIVFLFLWLSFRSLKYAIISFIPMAMSWIWILGIMALLGIKFNIVNIILATFIFGQGDDYTIFITEGCIYEREHGKSILPSYKQSILLSAIIMFIGIGTLIVAKHPALFSLAEITIIGMFCVVFMSWLVPPLLFRLAAKRER